MTDIEAGRSNTERAYLRLRREILHGGLMPGDRLTAADLQDRFALGLTPIREALMRLSAEGLVDAETHRGARVADVSRAALADLMATRRAIERLCLTASMANGGAAWEADVLAAMHLLSRTPLPAGPDDPDSAAAWEVQHRRFHFTLVGACRSEWLLRFWSTLADHSERFRKLRLLNRHAAEAEVRDVSAEHQAIMAAVLDRDVAAATALMDRHLLATEQSVARLLEAGYAPSMGASS
jgi:DNA-binding GntR family transcriptional regulator